MIKYRIIERTKLNGEKDYAIQEGCRFLFKWFWEDKWFENSLERAKKSLNSFESKKVKEKKVIYEKD